MLVLRVSTIPNVGFIARLAMPVLKDLLVISKIAVPVVSEPVPAVVGTMEKSDSNGLYYHTTHLR